ncbi:hypothetical protein [Paenibacillus apiarius]|uniref:hypothetical protein n=1 Tax=Paenibacillus apiarius TaxID=46240 RepID=UPI003B3A6F2A
MIALFKRKSYLWSMVGLAIFVLLAGATLTNAKSAVESAAQQKANLRLLQQMDSSIRNHAEQTVGLFMERLGKSLAVATSNFSNRQRPMVLNI